MHPEIEKKLEGLPQPDRWVVVDGKTGNFLRVPHQLDGRMKRLLDCRERNPDTITIPEYDGAQHGQDYWLYVVGDVAEGMKIKGRHAQVFVEGTLGKNASIKVEQGIVSAASLGEGSHVSTHYCVLVGSIEDSVKSKNIGEANDLAGNEAPLIIATKKEKRKEIFGGSFGSGENPRLAYPANSDSLVRSLRALGRGRLITGGFVSDTDHSRVLRDAGVPEIDPTQNMSEKRSR